ncbi:MAG TPA: 6-phosphogluconolactonase, partial [Actinomycetota bacterium]|nr:6-phosphogluconolactonase [Actinomycetota bacterium]
MSLTYSVFSSEEWADAAASHISKALPASGSVVLTGGSAARRVYPLLAHLDADWSGLEVFFSDERCVPPDHPESNYRMASELLLDRAQPGAVHRMRGELDPGAAAAEYHDALVGPVGAGLDLLLLGMGGDCHIGALYPDAPSLAERSALCTA